jgi:peptidoglycan-N-acetylglucosamine deacetylase
VGKKNKINRKNKRIRKSRRYSNQAFQKKRMKRDESKSLSVYIIILFVLICLISTTLKSSNGSVSVSTNVVKGTGISQEEQSDLFFEEKILDYINEKRITYLEKIRKEGLALYEKQVEEERRRSLEEEKRLEEQKILEVQKKLEEQKRKELKVYNRQSTKTAYLTFDDGPSKVVTPKILDILKQNEIKATFFVVGQMAQGAPDIVKRIYNEGHKVANHSYSHIYNNFYNSPDSMMKEIKMTEDILKEILGEGFTNSLFRFPGGNLKREFIDRLVSEGYHHEIWTALTRDAEIINPKKEQLVDALKSTFRNNTNEIILMHDIKTITPQYLQEIIDYIKGKGYVFMAME